MIEKVDIIVKTEIRDVVLTVQRCDLLKVEAVIVLPTNEFFNIKDCDWENKTPKSVMGKFVKELSGSERISLQKKIDETLTKDHSYTQTGFPFGHTIIVTADKNQSLLFTNTVKYDIDAIRKLAVSLNNEKLMMERELDDIGYLNPQAKFGYSEEEWHNVERKVSQMRHRDSEIEYSLKLYYETFLMAIGYSIRNIVKVSQVNKIKRVAIPLLGSGWGGLDEKLVFETIIGELNRAIISRNTFAKFLPFLKNYPEQVLIILSPQSRLQRQSVLQAIQTIVSTDASQSSSKDTLRLIQNEIDAVNQRIEALEKIGEDVPSSLLDQKEDLIKDGKLLKALLMKTDTIIEGDQIMGDKYEVGQAGAVGPNSHAHDMTFNQIWNQNANDIDLNELIKELSVLRKQLKIEATEPEHDSAVGAVASAEVAAQNGDGAKVLEHLATAGKWVLDVAQKLAIPVAIAALKSALGL